MSDLLMIRGIGLRSVITDHLFRVGPQTIPDILDALAHEGFTVAGRPGPAEMSRTTEQRIHRRALELRAQAGLVTGRDDEHFWDRLALYLE